MTIGHGCPECANRHPNSSHRRLITSIPRRNEYPRMRRILAMAGVVAAAMLAIAPTAYASTQTGDGADHSTCNADWYVNPDEAALKPTQTRWGLLFDGPSLIHHKPAAAYTLAHVPSSSFHAHLYNGVLPLFKLETSAPYSTLNKTADGKWWSSKIASGDGSQGQPVDSPADLVGKGSYTDATTVLSFGVGYANDSGNKALVTSVRFGAHFYSLACRPHKPGHSPTPTPSTTPTSPSGGGSTPTTVPSGAPQTGDGSSSGGANAALMVAGGLVVALGGGTGLLMWRRRSQH